MKKISKKIAVLLMLTLIVSLFSTITAMAGISRPLMPKNFNAHPGFKSVILTWSRSTQDIKGYRVYLRRPGGSWKLIKTLDIARYPSLRNVQTCTYKVSGLPQEYSNSRKYGFRVTAYVNDENGQALESAFKTIYAQPVREMRIRFTNRADGNTYYASRFSGGVFICIDKNGRQVKRVAGYKVGNESPEYTRTFNYSRLSAQYYINNRGTSSKTNYLVWVSTYTQHVYLMKGSKGKWKCIDDWECATGSADSPTPTGNDGLKEINKKVRSRHNVSWWSPFSSWNSLHGRVGDSMVLGRPLSGGCVRNPDEKARYIYMNCPVGTRVLIY